MSYNTNARPSAPLLMRKPAGGGGYGAAPAGGGLPLGSRNVSSSGSTRVQAAGPAGGGGGALSDVAPAELDRWSTRFTGGGSGSGGALARGGASGSSALGGSGSLGGGLYLASLNPYQVGWAVTARVFAKGEARSYTNERGPGQVASCTLIDPSAAMKCVMFGDQVDRFFPVLEVGRVVRISGASIRPARQNNFEAPLNDYEMTLTNDTRIEEVEDRGEMPLHSLRPVAFTELPEHLAKQKAMAAESGQGANALAGTVDVIGVVIEASGLQALMSKKGQELRKRDLMLMDKTGSMIKLTIWGDKQLDESQLEPPQQIGRQVKCNVLAVSATRLSDFAGCSLSTSFSSSVFVNPNWSEAEELRKWFASKGFPLLSNGQAMQLSSSGRGGSESTYLDNLPAGSLSDCVALKTAFAATHEPLVQPVLLRVAARVTFIKKTTGASEQEQPPWYLSCPNEQCKGKKVMSADASFYCEKCNMPVAEPRPRYLLSLLIQDETGSLWVTAFDREAEKILHLSASELAALKESSGVEAYSSVFQAASNHDFVFGIKAQSRTDSAAVQQYADQPLRFQLTACAPADYARDAAVDMMFVQEGLANMQQQPQQH